MGMLTAAALLFVCIGRYENKEIGYTVSTNIQNAEEKQREETKGKIALTFDDGPHPLYTEQLLDGLKERGVKATFFVTGEHAVLYPDIIRRMNNEGHLIGNHTYSHMQLKTGNKEMFREELLKTNETIMELTGEEVIYVRPPYGSWDKSFEAELNMFPVLWTVEAIESKIGGSLNLSKVLIHTLTIPYVYN